MQSRLGSARVPLAAFNDDSSSSSLHLRLCGRLTEADAFRATSRPSFRFARLVLSPVIYYRGVPSDSGKRIDGPKGPTAAPLHEHGHLACAYSNPSRRCADGRAMVSQRRSNQKYLGLRALIRHRRFLKNGTFLFLGKAHNSRRSAGFRREFKVALKEDFSLSNYQLKPK
jgi:hypothetical protein